jgi:hypothetical protein
MRRTPAYQEGGSPFWGILYFFSLVGGYVQRLLELWDEADKDYGGASQNSVIRIPLSQEVPCLLKIAPMLQSLWVQGSLVVGRRQRTVPPVGIWLFLGHEYVVGFPILMPRLENALSLIIRVFGVLHCHARHAKDVVQFITKRAVGVIS